MIKRRNGTIGVVIDYTFNTSIGGKVRDMKRIVLNLVVLVAVLALAACGGGQNQTTGSSSQNNASATQNESEAQPDGEALEKTKLVVGSSVFSLGYLPLYVADAKGYFKDEGLDVEVQYFNSGTQAFQAQVAGAMDIGAQSPNQAIDAWLANQNIKAFWSTSNYPAYEWWAAKEISSLEEAKSRNLKVGISQIGALSHLISVYALQKSGFDIEKNVDFVGVGGSSARMAALESGQVDLIPASPPENLILAKAGYNKLVELKSILDEFEWDLYIADDDFLNNNPNTIRAFLRANVTATKFIQSNPEEAAQIYADLVGYKPEQIPDVVEAVKELADYFPVDGHFAEEGIDVMLGFYKDSGDIDEIPDHSEFINYRYVEEFKEQ